MISLIILGVVCILIAVRRVGFIRLRIWLIMLLGAAVALLTGEISPISAAKAINLDVILFLFGVFVVGQALEDSGYLAYISSKLFRKARTFSGLTLIVILCMGLLSAVLMNDTVAIVGVPVVLAMVKNNKTHAKILLLALAFSVTIGSVMSPIGNPQNLLIALHGDIANPFATFFMYLLAPTIINLFLAYGVLRLFFRKHFSASLPVSEPAAITDNGLARLAMASIVILIIMVAVKVVAVFIGLGWEIRLTYIALAAAAPILLLSRRRVRIVKRIDWSTIAFFVAMFVLMASVWDTGYFQSLTDSLEVSFKSSAQIMLISVSISQLISNVPMVALYLPVIEGAGGSSNALMALAAGSTIAGNLTILGAASNVIIIQNAENKGGHTLTFWEFFRVGLPLTAANILVYWLFLSAAGG